MILKRLFFFRKVAALKKRQHAPELTQILSATKLPEIHFTDDRHHHSALFIGAKQHINSDWILLYDAQIKPTTQIIEDLKKNMKSLNIESLKILADSPETAQTEKSLESGLKSSFPATSIVYWPQ